MKSLDYFRQAESVLLTIGLDLDDLGEYDDRTQRWLEAATNLKNPRTKTFMLLMKLKLLLQLECTSNNFANSVDFTMKGTLVREIEV